MAESGEGLRLLILANGADPVPAAVRCAGCLGVNHPLAIAVPGSRDGLDVLSGVAFGAVDGFGAVFRAGCRFVDGVIGFPAMAGGGDFPLFKEIAGRALPSFGSALRTGGSFHGFPLAEAMAEGRDFRHILLGRIAVDTMTGTATWFRTSGIQVGCPFARKHMPMCGNGVLLFGLADGANAIFFPVLFTGSLNPGNPLSPLMAVCRNLLHVGDCIAAGAVAGFAARLGASGRFIYRPFIRVIMAESGDCLLLGMGRVVLADVRNGTSMGAVGFRASGFLPLMPGSKDGLDVLNGVAFGAVDGFGAVFRAGSGLVGRVIGFPGMAGGVDVPGLRIAADAAYPLLRPFIRTGRGFNGFPAAEAVALWLNFRYIGNCLATGAVVGFAARLRAGGRFVYRPITLPVMIESRNGFGFFRLADRADAVFLSGFGAGGRCLCYPFSPGMAGGWNRFCICMVRVMGTGKGLYPVLCASGRFRYGFHIVMAEGEDGAGILSGVALGAVDGFGAVFRTGSGLVGRVIDFPAMAGGVDVPGLRIAADTAYPLLRPFIRAGGRTDGFPLAPLVPFRRDFGYIRFRIAAGAVVGLAARFRTGGRFVYRPFIRVVMAESRERLRLLIAANRTHMIFNAGFGAGGFLPDEPAAEAVAVIDGHRHRCLVPAFIGRHNHGGGSGSL